MLCVKSVEGRNDYLHNVINLNIMNSNIIVYLLEIIWLYHIIKSIATKDHWEYGCGKEIVSVISLINVVVLAFVGICFVVRCL